MVGGSSCKQLCESFISPALRHLASGTSPCMVNGLQRRGQAASKLHIDKSYSNSSVYIGVLVPWYQGTVLIHLIQIFALYLHSLVINVSYGAHSHKNKDL